MSKHLRPSDFKESVKYLTFPLQEMTLKVWLILAGFALYFYKEVEDSFGKSIPF